MQINKRKYKYHIERDLYDRCYGHEEYLRWYDNNWESVYTSWDKDSLRFHYNWHDKAMVIFYERFVLSDLEKKRLKKLNEI